MAVLFPLLEQARFKYNKRGKEDFSILDIPDVSEAPAHSERSTDTQTNKNVESKEVDTPSYSKQAVLQCHTPSSSSNNVNSPSIEVCGNNNESSAEISIEQTTVGLNDGRDSPDTDFDEIDSKQKPMLSNLSVSYSPKNELFLMEYDAHSWTHHVEEELAAVAVVDEKDYVPSKNTFEPSKKSADDVKQDGSSVMVRDTTAKRFGFILSLKTIFKIRNCINVCLYCLQNC